MAYQYYLLSHPSTISNNDWTNYSSFRCLNRMNPRFGSSNKLVNYNDLLYTSPISSDSYINKYIPNSFTNARKINNNLTALYGPTGKNGAHMLLYYNDMTSIGPYNYISETNTDHGYIYTPIIMPSVSWFLAKYYYGRQMDGSSSYNYHSSDYKINWYQDTSDSTLIHINTASGATPGTTFPATTTNWVTSLNKIGSNYAIYGYHYFYIGFGTNSYNWNDSVTKPVLYIGSTNDTISFNVCLLIDYSVITNNMGFTPSFTNYAFYNLSHTSSQEISDPLLNPSSSSTYDFVLINDTTTYSLSANNPTDVNLMDAFDRIMTAKFGSSSYNSSYHRLYKNSIYHYFFLCCTNNISETTAITAPMNQLNGGYNVDGIYYILGKYTSSNESISDYVCTVIDCYYTGNKVYIIVCGMLAIKNLKYTFDEDHTIDNQTISSLLSNYPNMVAMTHAAGEYLAYDGTSSSDTPSSNPGVFYTNCRVSDDVRFATSVSGGDSYWYNANTWDSNTGLIGLSYAYAYAYTS